MDWATTFEGSGHSPRSVRPQLGRVRFGLFEADFPRQELRRKGIQVKLQQQPFQILRLLLERPGEIVSRECIREALWPDNHFVEFEQSISTAVLRLRRALRERAEAPIYIEAVARKGYRFIAPISEDSQSKEPIRAVAILPFQNFTEAEDTDYFVSGFADSLVTEMVLRSDLRVVPAMSVERFRNARTELRQIAKELGVQAVVEGSFLRSGDRIRVSARLLNVEEERHLWAQTYERNAKDILLVQQEIVHAIVASASAALRRQGNSPATKSIHPTAYESFLKGNFLLSFRAGPSLEKAFGCYQTAIDLEPEWAPPYAALAEAHRVADFSKYVLSSELVGRVRRLTGRALSLDPDNAQAHATMGAVRAIYEWQWALGEEEIKLAAELNPQSSQVEHLYATVLLARGRYQEALTHANAALALDQSSLFLRSHRVQVLHFSRRIEQAVTESRLFLDEHPDFAMGLLNYGAALLDLGRAEEALPVVDRLFQRTGMPAALCTIAHAHYELGNIPAAKDAVEQLYRIKETRGCSPMILALGNVVINELEQSLQWLSLAFEERDYRLALLGSIVPFDKVRDSAQFQEIYQSVYSSAAETEPIIGSYPTKQTL